MASPAKLFSCVDSKQICNSHLNLSPAKHQYSFSKTERFRMPLPYCDSIYNLPSMKSSRHTNLGIGKKTNLQYGQHPHNQTPSPDLYKIQSFVDINTQHKKGVNAHIGREFTTPRSYIELEPIKYPGPGRYDQLRMNNSPKWTMRPIIDKHLFPNTTQKIVPGSSTYTFNQQLNPEGRYSLSKFPSSGSKVWNPPSSSRFQKSSTPVPGSGTYKPVNDLSDEGKYVLAVHLGHGKRKFDQQMRHSFVNEPAKITRTPGPGSYRQPSEFGQYDQILNRSSIQ